MSKTIQEKQQDHNERMNMCAYECFEANDFGKELLESFKRSLLDLNDGKRRQSTNVNYDNGQEDLIRLFIMMIDKHKLKIQGIT